MKPEVEAALNEYFTTKDSLKAVADRHGIPYSTLNRHKLIVESSKAERLDSSYVVGSVASYKARGESKELNEPSTTERTHLAAVASLNELERLLRDKPSSNDVKNVVMALEKLMNIFTGTGSDPALDEWELLEGLAIED